MDTVAVLIPIYKNELDANECIALRQCKSVLGKYPVILVAPDALHIDNREFEGLRTERFADPYFDGIQGYNRLMLSKGFYSRFLGYEYILIYQLDAFVFEDKLLHFCSLGYDYIGAPWLRGAFLFRDSGHCIWYVGNGGFSLRNVSGCLKLVGEQECSLETYVGNEDLFFASNASSGFAVAPLEVALEFAFEEDVRRCFRSNGMRLPFGCHAWKKFDLEFWKPYIEACSHRVVADSLMKGNEDIRNTLVYEKCRQKSFFWENIYTKEILRKFLQQEKKRIFVWGAGQKGKLVGKLLKEAGIDIEGFLDSNWELCGRLIGDCHIFPADFFRQERGKAYAIIAVGAWKKEIAGQLYAMGCNYLEDFCFYTDIFKSMIEDFQGRVKEKGFGVGFHLAEDKEGLASGVLDYLL